MTRPRSRICLVIRSGGEFVLQVHVLEICLVFRPGGGGGRISFTRHILESVRCFSRSVEESLSSAPCWNSVWSFGHTSGGDFLLHAPCWNLCLVVWRVGSLYYSPPGISTAGSESVSSVRIGRWGFSLTHPVLESVWAVGRVGSLSYTSHVLVFCLVVRREESFSYTPRAEVCLVVKRVGVSLTHPVFGICLVVRGEGSFSYILESMSGCTSGGESMRTPCPGICLGLVGSFSYTPRDAISLVVRRVGRVSLSYTSHVTGNTLISPRVVRAGGEFSLNAPCLVCVCLVFCRVGSLYLTRPVLESVSFVVRRVGSFSYTPRAGICLVVRR